MTRTVIFASVIQSSWRALSPPSEDQLAHSLEDAFPDVIRHLKGKTIEQVDWDAIGYPNCLFILEMRPHEQAYFVGAVLLRLITRRRRVVFGIG
jgi:hypothetical protein